jgi:uncharacterized 2Fe-2S/4Fe-4S cluster protein (DUF4445 family)
VERLWSIHFLPGGKRISAQEGTTLLDAIKLAGIRLETPCGGKGECKQCRVKVIGGHASIREHDALFLSREEILEGYLLACVTPVLSDLIVYVPQRE